MSCTPRTAWSTAPCRKQLPDELVARDFTAGPERAEAYAARPVPGSSSPTAASTGYDGFADPVPVPAGAPPFDRALAASGRTPRQRTPGTVDGGRPHPCSKPA